jgi:hypothetical protein
LAPVLKDFASRRGRAGMPHFQGFVQSPEHLLSPSPVLSALTNLWDLKA